MVRGLQFMVDRSKAMNRELQTKNEALNRFDIWAIAPKSDISVFQESNANITRKTHATKATTQ
jgi:hypothetical protein